MAFNLVEYSKLKNSIIESIKTEIKSFDSKQVIIPDKLIEATECLSSVRKIQTQLLLKSIAILDTDFYIDANEKARILNTLAYCVHAEIVKSYEGTLLSADRSGFKRSLSTSLDLKIGNEPGITDLHFMYPSLIKFFQENVYNGADVTNGYLPEEKFKITGFAVEDYIDELLDKNLNNYKALSVEAKKIQDRSQPAKSSSLLGWWSSGDTTTKEVKVTRASSIKIGEASSSTPSTGLHY